MRLKNEAKVGLIVFLGIIALFFAWWFLGGLSFRASSYMIYGVFPNAQKLDKGSAVRMAGVKIGMVSYTGLKGTQAEVQMRIDNTFKIPKDSVARITTGGFIGENYIEITPGVSRNYLKNNSKIATAMVVQPDQLMEQTNKLLTELEQSSAGLNRLLGDKQMVAMIKDTVSSMNRAARTAAELTETSKRLFARNSTKFSGALDKMDVAATNAVETTDQIKDLVCEDVRPNVKALFGQVGEMAQDLKGAVKDAREIVKSMGGKAAGLENAFGKIDAALDNVVGATEEAKGMMANLNGASAGIKLLATDKEIYNNLKCTMQNAAAASAEARDLISGLNKKLNKRSISTPDRRSEVPERGLSTNSLWDTSQGEYRFDTYYTLYGGGSTFYRAGAYNVGENTGAILQGGTLLGGSSAVRYGLYDSRLGFGLDQRFGKSLLLSADVFRPNEPGCELRGVVGITPSLGIYGGYKDIFDTTHKEVLVGVRYNK